MCSCSWRQERCQVGGTALAGDRGEDHRPGVGAGPPDRPREAGRRGRQDQVPGRRGPALPRAPAETRGPAPSSARASACLAPGPARRGRHHPERRGRALLQRAGPPRPHQVASRPRCGLDSALALLCGGSCPGRDYVTGEMWKSKPPFRPARLHLLLQLLLTTPCSIRASFCALFLRAGSASTRPPRTRSFGTASLKLSEEDMSRGRSARRFFVASLRWSKALHRARGAVLSLNASRPCMFRPLRS